MTQNTEQNVRTRNEQVADLVEALSDEVWVPDHKSYCEKMILEAEARGAEEQRRKDAEGQEAIYQYQYSDQSWCDTSQEEYERNTALDPNDTRILYTRPANVATLKARIEAMTFSLAQSYRIRGEKQKRINEVEAEIASLKEAEQLARADAEASKARVKVLRAQLSELASSAQQVYLRGATTGAQWPKLAVSLSSARAALTREGEKA